MTEKRFRVEFDDADIWEDNHFLAVAYDHHNALKFAERLNELTDENEQLKQENKKLKQSFGNIRNSISRLYRNGQITFDERAFYLRKLSEIEDGDVE